MIAEEKLLNGTRVAKDIKAEVAEQVSALSARGITPGLDVVLVGADPASEVYVRSKAKTSAELGMRSETHVLPDDATQPELEALIDLLNADDEVDGILVQLPLPGGLDGTGEHEAQGMLAGEFPAGARALVGRARQVDARPVGPLAAPLDFAPESPSVRAEEAPPRRALEPFPRSGRVIHSPQILKETTAMARALKLDWPRNVLRHSFITYRLATVKSAEQVALEAGNFPAIIFRHYRELVTEEAAKKWFRITPPDGWIAK